MGTVRVLAQQVGACGRCSRQLSQCVADAQDGAPLDPVTVVISNYVLGRSVLRDLGRGHGVANVHAVRLADLAVSVLGGPAAAPSLLNTVLEMGAARSAVQIAGDGLRALSHHCALY